MARGGVLYRACADLCARLGFDYPGRCKGGAVMTALSKRKSRLLISTEDSVYDSGRRREVMLEAHPYHATIRLKGMKTTFEVSWASVYQLAVKQAVEAARREKRKRK